jgi:CheY-like chemotaxis protein
MSSKTTILNFPPETRPLGNANGTPSSNALPGPDMNYNLEQLLASVKEILTDKAQLNGITLLYNIIPGIPDLLAGNPALFEELLAKLLGLCIDSVPGGGYVKAEVSLRQMKGTEILLDIDVSDNGGWVSQAVLDEVFSNPEMRSSEITKNKKLANLVLKLEELKQLTRKMGSVLVGTAEPEKGTRFGFLLKQQTVNGSEFSPIEMSVTADSISMLSPFQQPPLKGLKVLIVDDNALNRVVVQKFLLAWQVETGIAENGFDAVRMVTEQPYDLILMDLQMPEMDGYSTTALIRNLPDDKGKNIPIVALTAFSGQEIKEKVLAAGMDALISKPLKPDALYARLSAVANHDPNAWAGILATEGKTTSDRKTASHPQGKLLNFSSYLSYPAAEADFLKELTLLTIAQLNRTGREYPKALQKNDQDLVHAIYHRIKPTLDSLDFYKLEQLLTEGKNNLGNQNKIWQDNHLATFEYLIATAIAELEEAKKGLGG